MRRNTLKVLLALGDYVVMFLSLLLVLYVRYSAEGDLRVDQHLGPFALIFAFWVTIFYILELYDVNAPFNHRNFLYAMLANIGIAGLSFYLFAELVDISPRRNLALVAAVFVLLFYFWRFLFGRLIDNVGWYRNVAVIGSDEHSLSLVCHIEGERRQGFRVSVIVRELRHREWTNKKRVTKKTGKVIGGKPFNKATLHNHLVNPVYIGKITHKGEIYDGVHEAIVDPEIFERVQKLLRYNGRTGGFEVRNKYGALLRGLITCKACGYAMTHTFTKDKKGGPRFYRYYRCTHAIKNGASECPSRTLPAAEIERVVVDEIRGLGSDRALLKQVLADAHATIAEEREGLVTERADLKRTLDRCHRELQTLAAGGLADTDVARRIAELHEQITAGDKRLPEVEKRIGELDAETITQAQAEAAFRDFDPVWENLIPREQARLIRLLVSAVEYDAVKSSVSMTFRPTSIRAFLDRIKEDAA